MTARPDHDEEHAVLPSLPLEPDVLAEALPHPVVGERDADAPATVSVPIDPEDAVTVPPPPVEDPGPVIPPLPPSPGAAEPEPTPDGEPADDQAAAVTYSTIPAFPDDPAHPAPARTRADGPEGFWPHLVHTASLGLIKPKDSWRVRARQALDDRIAIDLDQTVFVPVLARKGGVGKTTVSVLLATALAAARADRVLALDANPDRGTLAERFGRRGTATVRDIVTNAGTIAAQHSLGDHAAIDPATGLSVLASDADPLLASALDEGDYHVLANLAAGSYAVVVSDSGTGLVEPVMRAALVRADTIVVVSGGSADEARLASETLTWLEANGHDELVAGAVVAINTATPATSVDRLDEIRAHFAARVREVVIVPYDEQLAAGSVVDFRRLHPATRFVARQLAAAVMDGIGDRAAAEGAT